MLLHKQIKDTIVDDSYAFEAAYAVSPHHQIPPYRVALEALRHPLFIDAMHVHGSVMVELQ